MGALHLLSCTYSWPDCKSISACSGVSIRTRIQGERCLQCLDPNSSSLSRRITSGITAPTSLLLCRCDLAVVVVFQNLGCATHINAFDLYSGTPAYDGRVPITVE